MNTLETQSAGSLHPAGSARLYECPGCGERKPQDKFPDDPAVPGLCAACDLLVRSADEPLETVHREEAQNDKVSDRRERARRKENTMNSQPENDPPVRCSAWLGVFFIDVQLCGGLRGDFVKTAKGHIELHISEILQHYDPTAGRDGYVNEAASERNADSHVPDGVVDNRERQLVRVRVHKTPNDRTELREDAR